MSESSEPKPWVIVSPLDGSVIRSATPAAVPVESCEHTDLIAEAQRYAQSTKDWTDGHLIGHLADALEATTKQLAAAQAVIAEADARVLNPRESDAESVPLAIDIHSILSQSPVDALAAHDTEVFNAGLSRAAEIADQYAEEAREYRDNETDYPESWVGVQHHGMYHGAQDVAIRIRAAVPHDSGSPDESS